MNNKSIKYIAILVLIAICGIFYFTTSRDITDKNIQILNLSSRDNRATQISSEVDTLLEYKDHISEIIYNNKMSKIYSLILVLDYDEFGYLKNKDLETIKDFFSQEKNRISAEKSKLISDASFLKKRRDTFLLYTLILLIIMIIVESTSYIKFSSDISSYLKDIELKNYDFKMDSRTLPYNSSIYSRIDDLRLNLKAIDDAISGTLKGYGLKETLEEIFNNKNFKRYIDFDRIGFATIQDNRVVASFSFSDNRDSNFKPGYNILLDKTSLVNLKSADDLRIIDDFEEYLKENPGSNSTELLYNDGYRSSLTAPITDGKGNVAGFLFFSSMTKNKFVESDKYKVKSISNILSSIFSKNMLIDDLVTNAALGFVKLVEDKDPETGNHLERMQIYSRFIAMDLFNRDIYSNELDINKVMDIYKYAPLHDIGKVGIPDSILLKNGKLTDDEMNVMKRHSLIGSSVLILFEKNLRKYEHDFFNTAINISLYHHEKWDGSGYPEGLSGLDIPIEARIVTIADVFDALASKRIYKEAFSFEKSADMVLSLSGKFFDPEVVESFVRCLPRIRKVYDELKEV